MASASLKVLDTTALQQALEQLNVRAPARIARLVPLAEIAAATAFLLLAGIACGRHIGRCHCRWTHRAWRTGH
jgi:hypothetical protein